MSPITQDKVSDEEIYPGLRRLGPAVVTAVAMDTKGIHVNILREELARRGRQLIVIDTGLRPHHADIRPADITFPELALAAGTSVQKLRSHQSRAEALKDIRAGLSSIIDELKRCGKIQGFIGLGGGTNASLAAHVFARLPMGMPKVLVSTVASGDTKAYVGGSDVVLVHSVVDFIGASAPIRAALARTAAIIDGIIDIPFWQQPQQRPVLGMTATGATTAAAEMADAWFTKHGWESLSFHARGPGGMALEAMAAEGRFTAVLDLATTEIADEVVGGRRSAGPARMEAAGRMGIPQLVVPGCVDLINFDDMASVPVEFRGRKFISHTPLSNLMRTSAEESEEIGRVIATKLARATGPVHVMLPMGGFSSYDRPGQPFYDAPANEAFRHGLIAALDSGSHVTVETSDLHINDPAFARSACLRLAAMVPLSQNKEHSANG